METNYSRLGAELANADAGWEAYDSWISWANEAANQLYANRLTGGITSPMFEAALRLQRIGDAIASAIFGNLWPALELPTAGQLLMLRGDVAAFRDELRAANRPLRSDHASDERRDDGTAPRVEQRHRRRRAAHPKIGAEWSAAV
jgi:hypothetical protein